ncbi:MAG TPA: histidine phosphatase family protein [Acidimicrobiales bacterium]|nr:histidine phosphatase family protein [Acidimicrobiales bacterium]
MSRLVLVRHGEAAARWNEDTDPGLSERGRQQAAALSYGLGKLAPMLIVTSPLRRARETAAPLAAHWGVEPVVDAAVGEVPSPTDDLAGRMAWLASVLSTPFEDWPTDLQAWRQSVVAALCALPTEAVVFTHYVFITVAAGVAGFRPDHCSQTVVSVDDGRLSLVSLGTEADTVVR